MKKTFLLMFMLFSASIFAKPTSDDDNSTAKDVIIDKGESMNPSEVRPRTLIPITCVYIDGMVQLTFLEDLGEYTLTVTNQTTGECWSTNNTPVLSTSTADGAYLIEIVTEDGSVYYGTYTL